MEIENKCKFCYEYESLKKIKEKSERETVTVGTNGIMTGEYIISQLSTNRIPMITAVGQRGEKNDC